MSQYLLGVTYTATTDEAKRLYPKIDIFTIWTPNNCMTLYHELINSRYTVPAYDKFRSDFDSKIRDMHSVDMSYSDTAGLQLTIRVILEYQNVPKGRNVNEIMAVIYYAAAKCNLIQNGEIKYSDLTFGTIFSQCGVLRLGRFDWNIVKLMDSLYTAIDYNINLTYQPGLGIYLYGMTKEQNVFAVPTVVVSV